MTVQNARILHGKRNFDVSTDLPMFDGTAVLTSSCSCTGTRTAVQPYNGYCLYGVFGTIRHAHSLVLFTKFSQTL